MDKFYAIIGSRDGQRIGVTTNPDPSCDYGEEVYLVEISKEDYEQYLDSLPW
jgi:hypothetical protein